MEGQDAVTLSGGALLSDEGVLKINTCFSLMFCVCNAFILILESLIAYIVYYLGFILYFIEAFGTKNKYNIEWKKKKIANPISLFTPKLLLYWE